MRSIKVFITLLIVNCTLLIGSASAQWWVQGGNLLWPYGDVSITKGDIYTDKVKSVSNSFELQTSLSSMKFYDISGILGSFRIDLTDATNVFGNASVSFNPEEGFNITSGSQVYFDNPANVMTGNLFVEGKINNIKFLSGTVSPEGSVVADVGSLYIRTTGGAGTTLYVKESGTGNTGWIAK